MNPEGFKPVESRKPTNTEQVTDINGRTINLSGPDYLLSQMNPDFLNRVISRRQSKQQ
ncbi:hypothetical protein KBC75_02380 [Candidatus Shapirobacteria bacterium]|nr:hypothetical protein [Candidatus Shapirobacteria bacterium]